MRVSFGRLVIRSLRFHWRGHLGVLLGAAVGSAALSGALVVGDSVRESLRELALQRLGNVHFAMETGDREFRARLAKLTESSISDRAARAGIMGMGGSPPGFMMMSSSVPNRAV